MPQNDNPIAVLGAGPMGLAVAYQLLKDGYKPIIFEADDRIGGMTASFNFKGLDIERYYHFHCTSDTAFLQMLDELQLSDKMHWTETKMGYWYQNQLQPWGNPLALLKFKGLGLLPKLRYGLHAFISSKRNNWQSLDPIEATDWIQKWVGKKAYDVLWHKLFALKFYDYAETLSAAWIWSRIRRIGRSRYDLFREKLGYLEGGSNTLLTALNETIIENGGKIELKTPVKKVVIENNAVKGIETLDGFRDFNKVISTVPLPYIEKLIPDLPEDVLTKYRKLKNIAVVCAIVKLHQSVSENFWLNINDPEMDIPGIVEYSNLRPLEKHIIYVPFYMPGEHEKYQHSDDVFIKKVTKYLKTINPGLSDNDFIDIHIHRYRFAQPICQPGFLQQLPPVKLPITGLSVADTSFYYPEDRGISESIEFGRQMAKDALV